MPKRLLVAIMFTDMVGYTAIMQQDEKVAKKLRDLHRLALEEETENFGGQILQYYGDGSLSIYTSSLEAVDCAIAIQKRVKNKVSLRIGIHIGDVVKDEDGAIYGNGVNVASRIESMAISGAVLVSGKLHDDIKNQSVITTKKLGAFELKNVEQPVDIFAITNGTLNVPTLKEMKGKGNIKQRSIAVLPFSNMSADPENEYFSDGISEEILNALVKVEDLKVTARTSSFVFKGENTDIREIGKILNVENILEGSVRRAGNRVRITAQLISAVDGYHLWSETFDRDLEDIFAVQDEISKIITTQLRIKLSLESYSKSLVEQPTENIEAYNLYLKGRFYWNKWSPENVKMAISLFHQAIELEPEYVAAYASLAGCYIFLAVSGISNPNDAYPKAFEYADKALALDENNPDSLQAIAMVDFLFNRDRKKAVRIFEKVLTLNPKHADAHHFYSMLLCVVGDLDKALEEIKASLQVDPLSLITIVHLADVYLYMGRFEEALLEIDRVLDMDSSFRMATEKKAWILYYMGKNDLAIATFKKYQAQTGSELKGLAGLGYMYAVTGHPEKAEELLLRIDKREEIEEGVVLEMDRAVIFMGLANMDKVFYHIEKALKQNVGGFYVSSDPLWLPLKDDPRFEPIAKKYKLI
jgi:adenylate cyclase